MNLMIQDSQCCQRKLYYEKGSPHNLSYLKAHKNCIVL